MHFWSELKMVNLKYLVITDFIMPHGGQVVQESIPGSLWPNRRVGLSYTHIELFTCLQKSVSDIT